MKAATYHWTASAGWNSPIGLDDAQLVLYFGPRVGVTDPRWLAELKQAFPHARLVGCTTGGQIYDGDVSDDRVVALALQFARTPLALASRHIEESGQSFTLGAELGRELARPDLKAVFVLSDGLRVNGSALVSGILSTTGTGITLSGGLAGDGSDFAATFVGADDMPLPGRIAAVGFYGDAITLGHGTGGGWSEFGPHRRVTRSEGNVLYELDGQPALDLYERYLGEDAAGLPSTALLYPLLMRDPANPGRSIVRTVLAIDREHKTMTFAGDVPQGWSAQLMRGYFDRLANAAGDAAQRAAQPPSPTSETAAILVSCIGRRILMGQSIIDEVAAAEENLGPAVRSIGFYSYGEIAPHSASGICELHNQTMTVTTLAEAA